MTPILREPLKDAYRPCSWQPIPVDRGVRVDLEKLE